MDSQLTSQHPPLLPAIKNPIWKLKHERDCEYLKKKLGNYFADNILSLYDQSLFTDLELHTEGGKVLCHCSIVSTRWNSLWILLCKIAKIQPENCGIPNFLIVQLENVDFYALESFIRSLYTNSIDISSWQLLSEQLQKKVPKVKPLRPNDLVIERLCSDEQQQINQLIADQLKKGTISELKGNLTDISHLFHSKTNTLINSSKSLTKSFQSLQKSSLNSDVSKNQMPMSSNALDGCEATMPMEINGGKSSSMDDPVSSTQKMNEPIDLLPGVIETDSKENSVTGDTSSLEVEMPGSHEESEKFTNPPKPLTRTRTFEIINPGHTNEDQNNGSTNDPVDLKELEKKKGSLIFENNFQTFSNIPTTNMMTMSLGSENSFGGSSIHSSMLSSLGSSVISNSPIIHPDPPSVTSEISNFSHSRSVTVKEAIMSPDSLAIDSQNGVITSSHKEDFSFEEKEKDDKESTSPSDISKHETEEPGIKIDCTDTSTTLPKDLQKQTSIVKDVDAIPVVTGIVSENESENQDPKSMFSMFINLDEIPSPAKEEPLKPHHSGVYMFIEADTLSPKVKRKCPLTTKDSKHSKLTAKEPCAKELQTDKKSFFVHIDSGNTSSSPMKNTKKCSTVMSKSAPTDSLLFGSPKVTSKSSIPSNNSKMTKSVIDRDEFIAQPPARRNVSVNDKINESSKIPRLVPNFYKMADIEKENKQTGNLFCALDFEEPKQTKSRKKKYADDMIDLPFDPNEDPSSVSDVSSLLSSLDRCSEKTEDGRRRNQETLGDDLLKMLVNEINTDVTIQVGDKKIRAHKCILASRCVYFAAMLSGHWVESSGNIIKLQGFSYDAVMVALKHIYSGTSDFPLTLKVEELAAISDMLVLDGLKESVALHLKATQCHYFHKPCADCLIGVLDVLPIAGAFCMDELFRKCLKWVAKHFQIVFPTRGFANLLPELQDRCVKQIIDDLSVSCVLDAAIGCDRVLCLIPAVKWAQSISDITGYMFESIIDFICANLNSVLSSDRLISMGRDGGWSIDKLEETLCLSLKSIKPDQAVLSHIQISVLLDSSGEAPEFSPPFIVMLEKLQKKIEKFLIHNANRVCVSRKWPLLPPETQKRIKEASILVFDGKTVAPRPKFSSASRVRDMEPTNRARASSMSDQRLNRNLTANKHERKLKSTSDRCQTPPAPLKQTLQTPLATRTSVLRAQAAIQRSQSARSVADRPKRIVKHIIQDGTDDSSEANSNFSRGATFTRSTNEVPNRSRTPIRNIKNKRHSQLPIATCRSESKVMLGHKRNSSGPQLGVQKSNYDFPNSGRTYSLGNQSRPHAGLPSTSNIPKLASSGPNSSGNVKSLPKNTKCPNGHGPQLSLLRLDSNDDDDEGTLWSLDPAPKLSRSNTFSKEPV